jgi:hypothetical protein
MADPPTQVLVDTPEATTEEKIIHKAKPIEGMDAYIGMIIVASVVLLYFTMIWAYSIY